VGSREENLIEVLLGLGVAPRPVALARQYQARHGGDLEEILLRRRFVSEREMNKARAILRGEENGSSASERRHEERIDAPDDFEIEVREASSHEVARIHDLSQSGLGIEVNHAIGPGTRLAVEVRSPRGTRVTCIARVRHSERTGDDEAHYNLGLELIELSPAQRLALKALINAAKERGRELVELQWLES